VLPFPVTHRSVLERIRSEDADVRRAAFGDLAIGYWKPSYHYLRLHWRLDAEEAEDLVQAFFATAFEKSYLERYDPAQARFRTFLRTCLDRFLQNHRKAERALKRGGHATVLSLDFPGAEQELGALAASDLRDLDRFFQQETIRALFARTVDAVQAAFEQEGKPAIFQAFDRHDLRPTPETTYRQVASDLGLTTAQVTNYLHAARKRFRELALENLRAVSATDEEFRREARELFGLEVEP
jgi:RNA polymerase sigma factor (sigma-70 family)